MCTDLLYFNSKNKQTNKNNTTKTNKQKTRQNKTEKQKQKNTQQNKNTNKEKNQCTTEKQVFLFIRNMITTTFLFPSHADINECQLQPPVCNGIKIVCINRVGSYECVCTDPEYILYGNTCIRK